MLDNTFCLEVQSNEKKIIMNQTLQVPLRITKSPICPYIPCLWKIFYYHYLLLFTGYYSLYQQCCTIWCAI